MIEHKAFLFDYINFDRELRPILEDALVSGDCGGLVSFIVAHLHDLRDPYESEALGDAWETMIETQDAHQYGDFALTKYYNPAADIGLGATWQNVQELVAADPALTVSPILGSTIGPQNDPFDPGKMGAYFQTSDQVREHHKYLLDRFNGKPLDEVNEAIQMLEKAIKAKSGLYVTF